MTCKLHITLHPPSINGETTLSDFYNLVIKIGKLPFVRFTQKTDEADTIQWAFTYRKRQLTLQYSIYSGLSIFADKPQDSKLISQLADKLQLSIIQMFNF